MRLIGLEPTRLTTPDPKSGAATNYAIAANWYFERRKGSKYIEMNKRNLEILVMQLFIKQIACCLDKRILAL